MFVVEQRSPYQDIDGRDDEPGTRHLWVTHDGAIASYLRLLREPDGTARIGRVCTAKEARGRGLSRTLMEAAMKLVDGPATLDAQLPLTGFYESFGFAVTGPEFDDGGIPHVPMRRR